MDTADKILNNLRRQCSRREYCTADVLKKAEKALDGNHQQAVKVLDVLVEEKFVDDRRYAAAFARDKSTIAGWGAVKIRYMLSAKGISKDIISEALEEVDVRKADDRLRKLLENKNRSLKEDPQRKMKLLRFALGRGYSYDEVSAILNVIEKKGYDEEI